MISNVMCLSPISRKKGIYEFIIYNLGPKTHLWWLYRKEYFQNKIITKYKLTNFEKRNAPRTLSLYIKSQRNASSIHQKIKIKSMVDDDE